MRPPFLKNRRELERELRDVGRAAVAHHLGNERSDVAQPRLGLLASQRFVGRFTRKCHELIDELRLRFNLECQPPCDVLSNQLDSGIAK